LFIWLERIDARPGAQGVAHHDGAFAFRRLNFAPGFVRPASHSAIYQVISLTHPDQGFPLAQVDFADP